MPSNSTDFDRGGGPAPVAIVGAGPVGLSLALGLARHGTRSILIEQQPDTSGASKAPAVHARTLETLEAWGVATRFRREGRLVRSLSVHSAPGGTRPLYSVDFGELEDVVESPGILLLEQSRNEAILLDEVIRSGLCDVRFETRAVDLECRPDGASVITESGRGKERVNARYVAACDGADSSLRSVLGLSFDGITYSIRPMLADVEVESPYDLLPWPRLRNHENGITVALRLRPGLWRLIRLDLEDPDGDEVSDAEVRRRLGEVLGTTDGDIVWSSRFRIHRRSISRFRHGHVLFAGDAAHVHSPVGGMGMNAGIQDAGNLAWKLASVLRGGDADRLLDSYDVERREIVVQGVSRFTDLITRFFIQSPRAVRRSALTLLDGVSSFPWLRRSTAARMMMVDLAAPSSPILDSDERAAGARLPNPILSGPLGGDVRLHHLLPVGPALIEVSGAGIVSGGAPMRPLIRIGPEGYRDRRGILRDLLGGRDGWILVRPDRHVAWARHTRRGMAEAIDRALGGTPAGEDGYS